MKTTVAIIGFVTTLFSGATMVLAQDDGASACDRVARNASEGGQDARDCIGYLNEQLAELRGAVAALQDQPSPTPEQVKDAILADREAREVLRGEPGQDGADGQPGESPDVTEIAAVLVRDHADDLRGPQGEPGPAVSGMVVASTALCSELPGRWEPFEQAAGRFIVGNDGRPEWRVELDGTNPVFAAGGEAEVRLVPAQIPAHSHEIGYGTHPVVDARANGATIRVVNHITVGETEAIGGTSEAGVGQSHNNMPPYIALYWCTPETREAE